MTELRSQHHEWVMERLASALKREEGTGLSFADVRILSAIIGAAEDVLKAAGEGTIESSGLGASAPLRVLRAALYGGTQLDEESDE